ncbi:hypothetical protein [Nostoc punctiforme]|nr:hypothetical protein [Nostoc punctiforme]
MPNFYASGNKKICSSQRSPQRAVPCHFIQIVDTNALNAVSELD